VRGWVGGFQEWEEGMGGRWVRYWRAEGWVEGWVEREGKGEYRFMKLMK
jgi:hypothetical protein